MARFEEEIHLERLNWFINLRWLAVVGGLFALWAGPVLAPLEIRVGRLMACVLALGLLNGAYLLYWERLKASGLTRERLWDKAGGLLHLQMFLDLIFLTALLFFSGGSQNPLLLLYLFHLAISAILFSEKESLFYAGLAAGLPWALYFVGPLNPYAQYFWRGTPPLSPAHAASLLWAHTVVVAGLWFFLSRLSKDIKAKERALRENAEKLSVANEGLKQMDTYKNRFLRQVVFQLKNPVIDMDFDLSAVERMLPAKQDKARKALGSAKKRVWSLLELIENLVWLTNAKAEDMPFKKDWVPVYETLLKAVQSLEAEAAKKGITFKIHGDPQTRLMADPGAFRKVADNLLTNAVKYTPAGSHPVRVEFQEAEGKLLLTVEDEGIGIPPKQQKKLFQEFFRATNAKAHERTGTGLGLSIVKRILDWHQGEVLVESEAGKGTKVSTFWPMNGS